jgi:hypothetical protein
LREIIVYLSNLLNISLDGQKSIILSSAQQARFLSWCDQNEIEVEVKRLRKPFTLDELFTNSPSQVTGTNASTQISRDLNLQKSSRSSVGIDIQSVSEMFPAAMDIEYDELKSLYTNYELQYSKNSSNPKLTLAGLFSLKESLIKAGAQYADYLDLEITNSLEGAPIFHGFEVSISHSGDIVTSIAIRSYESNLRTSL